MLRLASIILLSVFLVLLGLACVWIPGSYREYKQAWMEEQKMMDRVHEVYRQNQQKELFLRNMMDDPEFLQQQAREQLGYVLPGEVVYRFDPLQR
jgi:cell division protein FtsB